MKTAKSSYLKIVSVLQANPSRTYDLLAAELQCSVTTVSKVAKKFGLVRRRGRKPGVPGVVPKRAAEVVQYATLNPRVSMAHIGREFGITRERARQILVKYMGETGRERQRRRKVEKARELCVGRYKFAQYVRAWLAGIGYGYCSCTKHTGDVCQPLRAMTGTGRRCKACVALVASRYAHKKGIFKT